MQPQCQPDLRTPGQVGQAVAAIGVTLHDAKGFDDDTGPGN